MSFSIRQSDKVNMALKTLTLLFIGGASSTAQLLSCQSEDGGGVEMNLGRLKSNLRESI